MRNLLHRALAVLMLLLLVFCSIGASGSSYYDEKISELKAQAEEDHMRFIELPDTGYNAEIAADIQVNDHKILEETPTGSIKVTVIDADTNQPIEDAMVLLTATLSYYSTVDGVSTQTGNAFLAANLGQTSADGICLYDEPLFYHDDDILNDDGTLVTDLLDYLSVGIATVDVATAKICLQPVSEETYLSEESKLILDALDPQGVWAYADFVAAVAAIPGVEKADLAVDNLLDDWIAAYTDDTVVKLYRETDPRLDAFGSIGDSERQITIGELKTFIQNNHPLLIGKIVNKYYRTLAGYTPTFKLSGAAEVQETIVYKDGTSEVQTDNARLYLDLFAGQEDGSGLAYISSGFSYRAYAFHPDYTSGITKGASVRQYLNAADQELVILLSKDTPPISVNNQRTFIYGRLIAADGKPLAGARISNVSGSLSTQSDGDGYFTLSVSDPGKYSMKITPADTAEAIAGNMTLNGGDPQEEFVFTVGKTPARYHINWYQKGYELSQEKDDGSPLGSRWLVPVLIILAVLIILIALVLILASRKKRRQNVAAPPSTMYATTAFQPLPQYTAAPMPAAAVMPAAAPSCNQCGAPLSEQEQFCHNCGARICPACHTASRPGTQFCSQCGRRL